MRGFDVGETPGIESVVERGDPDESRVGGIVRR
jgi:hypothetical protein